MGPLAFIYINFELSDNERSLLANELIKSTNIPLLIDTHGIKLRAWTKEGEFFLPNDADKLIGKNHPFLKEVTHDLIKLCRHAHCGDYVLSGWSPNDKPITFPVENGAHAGPGKEETRAFALLPNDCNIQEKSHGYLRAVDIRKSVFQTLNYSSLNVPRLFNDKHRVRHNTVRVMTYNCHSCIGMDGKLSPRRIAKVIAKQSPDIIALQELDSGRQRTKKVDQAHMISKYLQMDFHFHPILKIEEELYGDAVLTCLPMKLMKADKLPALRRKLFSESRGGLWVEVNLNGINFHIINTHLSLWPGEQKIQVDALVGNEWLYHPDCEKPVILLGDFNARPSSTPCVKILDHLNDAQTELDNHYPIKTFSGRFPLARIDHIFIDSSLDVISIDVPSSQLERVASDHLPLVAELRFN
jgi:endonuclease/exonuclease/phosphatase family metal-dependent hydrolase